MTPVPPPAPKDDDADVRDVLNEPAADEGFDPDTVDADFEQELEDLFADDLEDAPVVDESGGPIVLDDQVETPKPAPQAAPEAGDDDLLVLDEVVEEAPNGGDEGGEEDDLLLLDDLAEESDGDDDLIVLDEVVELVERADAEKAAAKSAPNGAEAEALVADIAEDNQAEEPEDEEIIDLDDLIEEPEAEPVAEPADEAAEEEPLIDLDDLIEEEVQAEPEEEISLDVEVPDLDEDLDPDLLASVMDDEPAPEMPVAEPESSVEEAMDADALDAIMDEPEGEEPEPFEEPAGPVVVDGNVFADLAAEAVEAPVDAELTGLDQLEDDDIEDVDSLLDNVEVDVSGVVDAEEAEADLDDDLVMDLEEGSLDEVLAAEAMPPDAGMDVEEDVALLLAETHGEDEPTLESLQAKVRQLEGRVEELEHRLREEIAQLVPAEAAKIIREEIAALAADLDD
ncbi:hypothetical protein DND132_2679 [Pseudodesulfovibrio mercurii]|uniref:Uncharacterized protein n=1 Tax=Pseudodesulfovibrio mercurii TaxID=641491 RepID=F0JIY3_9BACT|nr:hypothetical protein [Pseudodesulfovibrio mercurii]EGB15882.1 hypothetical protein DND132_2679 [Pseudodesulfovibrio mercurii]